MPVRRPTSDLTAAAARHGWPGYADRARQLAHGSARGVVTAGAIVMPADRWAKLEAEAVARRSQRPQRGPTTPGRAAGRTAGKDAAGAKPTAVTWADRGPPLWDRLHRWAATADLADLGRWLAAFATQIPCGDCKAHWVTMVRQTPPPTDSHAALCRWTYDRHVRVSERIGTKAEFSFEAAVAKYRWPPS